MTYLSHVVLGQWLVGDDAGCIVDTGSSHPLLNALLTEDRILRDSTRDLRKPAIGTGPDALYPRTKSRVSPIPRISSAHRYALGLMPTPPAWANAAVCGE